MKTQIEKIGWFDSVGMPSHVHLLSKDRVHTLCGHIIAERVQTGQTAYRVPEKQRGHSRRCRVCFSLAKGQQYRWAEGSPRE